MNSKTQVYNGSCHCGAIGYSYSTELLPERWPIRADQCSFCRAHAGRTTSDPAGMVEFHVKDDNLLRLYRFGQRTADFLICSACGVYIGAKIEAERGRFAVININAMNPCPEGLSAPQPVSYEGESVAERTLRRQERWTPCR